MSIIDRKNRFDTRLSIEDRGASRLKRLTQVAVSKSTTQRVVELAWTAGPVTLLASIGGYYMGHGKALPKETLIFFIAYTIIAGLIGLVAHLANRLGRGQRQQQAEEQLSRVMGMLPDLVLDLRDLHLQSLPPEQRTLEAARILLQSVDLGPRWLASAVRSIGGSTTLANAIEDIDIFLRAGMSCRARDIYQANEPELKSLAASLRPQLPALADSLERRFTSDGYDPRSGLPRGNYFIERLFAAIDEEDDTLMTLEDVEEVYILLFELLCGRSIPMLIFSFAGASRLARDTEALEERRFRFRIVRARAYSRLLALATFLSQHMDEAVLVSPAGLTGRQLLSFCSSHMETLVARIKLGGNDHRRWRSILEQALGLYHQAYIAYLKTDREYQDFQAATERWKRRLNAQQGLEVAFNGSGDGRGLRIVEDQIHLSDGDKLKVVRALADHFRYQRGSQEDPEQRLRGAKQLAVRVALILDEVIQIRRPEVQRAIYNANTLNMGVFERDLSTKTKIGWGEALAKEIEKDMSSASQALVAAIYGFYGLKLDPQSRLQLAQRYGSTVEQLEQVYQEEGEALSRHTRMPVRPFRVPRASLEWRLALSRGSDAA